MWSVKNYCMGPPFTLHCVVWWSLHVGERNKASWGLDNYIVCSKLKATPEAGEIKAKIYNTTQPPFDKLVETAWLLLTGFHKEVHYIYKQSPGRYTSARYFIFIALLLSISEASINHLWNLDKAVSGVSWSVVIVCWYLFVSVWIFKMDHLSLLKWMSTPLPPFHQSMNPSQSQELGQNKR